MPKGYKHGFRYTPEYKIWTWMKQRCTNPNNKDFKDYGGRGISVCDEWMNSFPAFLRDMGERPDPEFQLDREDNSKGYCKENCRWITRKKNVRNQRSNIRVTMNGETKCLSEWCEELGENYWKIHGRYRRGKRGKDLFKSPRSYRRDTTQ